MQAILISTQSLNKCCIACGQGNEKRHPLFNRCEKWSQTWKWLSSRGVFFRHIMPTTFTSFWKGMLIHEMEGSSGTATVQNHQQISYDLAGNDSLHLPDLPPQFQKLHLPPGWYVPGMNSKRKKHKDTWMGWMWVIWCCRHLCSFFSECIVLTESLSFTSSMTVTSLAKLVWTAAEN